MRHVKTVINFDKQRQSPVFNGGMKNEKDRKNATFGKDTKQGQSEYRIEKTTGKNIVK